MDVALLNQYKKSLSQATEWLLTQIDIEGHLKTKPDDILAYYALPYLLANVGLNEESYRMLNYVMHSFATQDGGLRRLLTDTASQPMKEQLPKVMSWMGVSAHRLGHFEISYAFSRYLRSYYDPEQGAFTAIAPYGRIEAVLDLFSSTMLGWFALYTGDLAKAQRAGNFLQRCLSLQTMKDQAFYIRLEQDGRLITSYPEDQSRFYLVTSNLSDDNLLYLSFPVVFLGKLFQATHEETYLRCAQSYFEASTQYTKDKHPIVGWGAAILGNITKETRYANTANDIATHFIQTQNQTGFWGHALDPLELKHSIENAIMLSETIVELSVI